VSVFQVELDNTKARNPRAGRHCGCLLHLSLRWGPCCRSGCVLLISARAVQPPCRSTNACRNQEVEEVVWCWVGALSCDDLHSNPSCVGSCSRRETWKELWSCHRRKEELCSSPANATPTLWQQCRNSWRSPRRLLAGVSGPGPLIAARS